MSAQEQAWRLIAEAMNDRVGQTIVSFAEGVDTPVLSNGNVFMAAIVGAQTAVLRALHACAEAGMVDRQGQFEVLLREITNIWGQLNDEPPTEGMKQ